MRQSGQGGAGRLATGAVEDGDLEALRLEVQHEVLAHHRQADQANVAVAHSCSFLVTECARVAAFAFPSRFHKSDLSFSIFFLFFYF